MGQKDRPKIISKDRQLFINILASLFALFVSLGINFFLSPYIVGTVGVEAYGFVQLGNNIITYLSIFSIALNSMSSRFISVSYFKSDVESANEYFTSTFFSNVILAAFFSPIILALIMNITRLINIPNELVNDVQLLLGFLSMDFIIGLLATNLEISYYISNKLYISSILKIYSYILRAVLLTLLFSFLRPQVSYIGLVGLIITVSQQTANIFWKRKLIPNLKLNIRFFRFAKVKELISSGVWNSITRLGSILSGGLDLLITNLMIGPTGMGLLSIAKIVPNVINTILGSLISTFLPNMTELFAKQKQEELIASVKQSMKIIGMIINIPIALIITFGDVLFSLWFPTQDAYLLQRLSILTVLPWAVMGQATIIHNIFTIVNRIRLNSILVTLTGFLNVVIVYVLLKITDLGLFAVAGTSAALSIVRNLLYTVPFGAIYIKSSWYTFYPEIVKSVSSVITISMVGLYMKSFMSSYTWFNLVIFSSILLLLGLFINFVIVLNKKDRSYIIDRIWNIKGR